MIKGCNDNKKWLSSASFFRNLATLIPTSRAPKKQMILKGKKQGKANDHLFPRYPSNPVKTSPAKINIQTTRLLLLLLRLCQTNVVSRLRPPLPTQKQKKKNGGLIKLLWKIQLLTTKLWIWKKEALLQGAFGEPKKLVIQVLLFIHFLDDNNCQYYFHRKRHLNTLCKTKTNHL